MPTGVYVRTDEYKEIMRKTALKYGFGKWMKGKRNSPKTEFIKGSTSGAKNLNWKGGSYINEGYIYILKPNHPFAKKNGYVAEHRLVLEKYLGRYLKKTESPHHKNRIRHDNIIGNLMLFKNKSAHVKFEHGKPIKDSDIVFDYIKLNGGK